MAVRRFCRENAASPAKLVSTSMENRILPDESSLGHVPVALSPRERFVEYLQSRGMRVTQQRLALIDHVFSRHEHFDADQLMEQLPHSGQPGHVSRPTVYRTLNEFVDAGLLRKFELDGRAVYEHDYGYPQHDHLYCKECQRLIEFQSDELLALRNAVAREHNFRVTSHRLIITGVCEECSRVNRRTKRKLDLI
jgi:Fur family transcriptional regulator, ferric uptake regulator